MRQNPRQKKVVRLDRRAWMAAAFGELAAHGWDGVRVEPIAATLGVTKGSFYWHFADRDALIAAMFVRWSEGRVRAIRNETQDDADPRALLYRLIDLYARGPNTHGLAIELAIRSAARADSRAAEAVAAVDGERLVRVSALFAKLGNKSEAEARAFLFYAFVFGQSLIAGRRDASLRAAASALIVD
ncbi:MAG: TetR/AcrR family transcriptional regulator [Xanthobacteraceae bacterium]|nr:TetR/AcrR family transcriptional regulator [Xanthobacteraceae bacterium]QYK43841.1 MAG: TetR/AcrR family transcriptional regulator [Xanthobacteraceae bacterium]